METRERPDKDGKGQDRNHLGGACMMGASNKNRTNPTGEYEIDFSDSGGGRGGNNIVQELSL